MTGKTESEQDGVLNNAKYTFEKRIYTTLYNCTQE